jgi:hypothetical protein
VHPRRRRVWNTFVLSAHSSGSHGFSDKKFLHGSILPYRNDGRTGILRCSSRAIGVRHRSASAPAAVRPLKEKGQNPLLLRLWP